MKTALEIVVALVTSILYSGAAIGLAIFGACLIGAGGGFCLYRWRAKRKRARVDEL